jgi:hypothetical protein
LLPDSTTDQINSAILFRDNFLGVCCVAIWISKFSRRFTPQKKNREKHVDVRNNWSGIRQQH